MKGYQVHSWNDLRMWDAGFMKGMQWIKIDLYYQDANFCATQQYARKNDSRGCLVLFTH